MFDYIEKDDLILNVIAASGATAVIATFASAYLTSPLVGPWANASETAPATNAMPNRPASTIIDGKQYTCSVNNGQPELNVKTLIP